MSKENKKLHDEKHDDQTNTGKITVGNLQVQSIDAKGNPSGAVTLFSGESFLTFLRKFPLPTPYNGATTLFSLVAKVLDENHLNMDENINNIVTFTPVVTTIKGEKITTVDAQTKFTPVFDFNSPEKTDVIAICYTPSGNIKEPLIANLNKASGLKYVFPAFESSIPETDPTAFDKMKNNAHLIIFIERNKPNNPNASAWDKAQQEQLGIGFTLKKISVFSLGVLVANTAETHTASIQRQQKFAKQLGDSYSPCKIFTYSDFTKQIDDHITQKHGISFRFKDPANPEHSIPMYKHLLVLMLLKRANIKKAAKDLNYKFIEVKNNASYFILDIALTVKHGEPEQFIGKWKNLLHSNSTVKNGRCIVMWSLELIQNNIDKLIRFIDDYMRSRSKEQLEKWRAQTKNKAQPDQTTVPVTESNAAGNTASITNESSSSSSLGTMAISANSITSITNASSVSFPFAGTSGASSESISSSTSSSLGTEAISTNSNDEAVHPSSSASP